MTNLSYSELVIGNGGDASAAYERLCLEDVSPEEVVKVREALEKYCELDTLAEVEILKGLREII